MSGTSLDGIDVAVVDIGRGVRTVAFHTTPYPARVREALLAVSNANTHTREIARLHFLLGELYARAVREACRLKRVPLASIELIGCHGQTVYHEGTPAPVLGMRIASTLQIGEPSVVAERLGIPVVADFRPRDIAAGGTGAPLVPFVDDRLFRHPRRGRVALNIGGIANITAIPPAARPEDVLAFDTGPGNMVIDALVAELTGGKQRFDRSGRIAASGRIERRLLADLMREAYYSRRPPKSAGREQYGEPFVARLRSTGLPLRDLVATATALTASTIALAIRRFVPFRADELIVSGGGVHNPVLMDEIAALLPGTAVGSSSAYGVGADAKEAIAFAVLARETWRRRPSNLPSATGARHPAVLGKVIQR